MLTLFGDLVLPSGGRAWLGAVTAAMDLMGVPSPTTRQALRRLVSQGTVTAVRRGRLAEYELTPGGHQRFEDAADRIYLRRPLVWDGRWRILTYSFTERQRAERDALRRELRWLGFGPISGGTWVSAWDVGIRLQTVLDKHQVAGTVDLFTAEHAGQDRDLASRAFDLDRLHAAHLAFVDTFGPLGTDWDGTDETALAERLRLVHEWRKFLFLDPGLPDSLLPETWLGDRAADVFKHRYLALDQPAWRCWDRLASEADPDGTVPSHPRSNLASPGPVLRQPSERHAMIGGLPADDHPAPTTPGDDARTEAFLVSIHAGRKVEPHDWMPDEYRRRNLRFIEMHANSEIMGALPEREWIARAPSLRRKRSLAAKVQDEVGHAHLIYRVAETLGKSRSQMYDDLIAGRTPFHNVFHYPTYSWGDVACIGFLVDGAAIVTQRALLETSYAPYMRVMKRVVAEESLHFRHGEDIMLALASGTAAQFEMLQEAVHRWWEPILHFFGTDVPREDDPSIHWGVKMRTNEESRQEWLAQYVPRLWDMGLDVPDPSLTWDADADRWEYAEPDWDRLMAIVKGEPTEATATRLWWRQLLHRHHAWVHDIVAGDETPAVTAA